jgi:hypothetical protein
MMMANSIFPSHVLMWLDVWDLGGGDGGGGGHCSNHFASDLPIHSFIRLVCVLNVSLLLLFVIIRAPFLLVYIRLLLL